jgi:hypothetical protein
MLLDDSELITTKIMEKSRPDFARARVHYDAILTLGGLTEDSTNCIET